MGYLSYDTLELPAKLSVKFLDLLGVLSWLFKLLTHRGVQDALEEVDPGCYSGWLHKEVRGNLKLKNRSLSHSSLTYVIGREEDLRY